MSKAYTVADYLIERLTQLGIRHMFGVPGDYNLHFLDHVVAHPQLAWVGCANELNAAYAADGYARHAPAAAMLTTFGVGELSAINGTAGSYAEYLPVIHIVGAPSVEAQKNRALLHHSLGDGDFEHFMRMAAEVTCAQASLTVENAVEEIDRVLGEAVRQRRPVYLLLPSDVSETPLRALPQAAANISAPCAPDSLQAFAQAARELLKGARHTTLLTDFQAGRFGQTAALRKLAAFPGLAGATMMMGKGILDESQANFSGTYTGSASLPPVKAAVEQADVLISVGVCLSDAQTAGFTHRINEKKRIDLRPFSASVGGYRFGQLPMGEALRVLNELAGELAVEWRLREETAPDAPPASAETLDQRAFWHQIQQFLQPGDIIITEQGTASFGFAHVRLPQDASLTVQTLWGSIGYTLPATLGAQMAQPDRRVVLIIGDGSAQLTIQELGTLLRQGLKPVILLLNNDGYTVERAIHGPYQSYNDIAAWNWRLIPAALSQNAPCNVHRAETVAELRQVLQQIDKPEALTLVEVMLPKYDVPDLLGVLCRTMEARNSAHG
ncbi:alpha-keto acid decarboxylase family protein [Enterobacillus tribolii]|uniref:Indolepyruvate decarboxylase n=1 Tax=Enterobacillus tribolii TaxID=1487935 RepID=A0A370QRQ2_9GAMM|nr:thiamine pyrophosphate-binding protein [Enterobacillus tribolii]MBW7983560.1 indolepyruvate decarboxylase [Enterobacillus tribolii]RDK91942.1 indolepyruvate decarboxylase [Enterobacillus tribolii]